MRKLVILLLCCLLLSSCGLPSPSGSETSTPTTSNPETPPTTSSVASPSSSVTPTTTTSAPLSPVTFLLYRPNEKQDGFKSHSITLPKLDPVPILDLLKEYGVIPFDVAVNAAIVEGDCLKLDMNEAFYLHLLTMGTLGEKLLMGSVVNTFLSAYGVSSVIITADQQIMNSGHVIYDFPLTKFE